MLLSVKTFRALAVVVFLGSTTLSQPNRLLPVLPPELEERADQIVVKVGFYVDHNGKPSVIRFISGEQAAYQAAASAVSQWEYAKADSPRLIEIQFGWQGGKARIQQSLEQPIVLRPSLEYSASRFHLKAVHAPVPIYPEQAKAAGITGYISGGNEAHRRWHRYRRSCEIGTHCPTSVRPIGNTGGWCCLADRQCAYSGTPMEIRGD